MRTVVERRRFTPRQVARIMGIGHKRILLFIKAGELPAINVATDTASIPRFLVGLDDIEEFERRRRIVAPSVINGTVAEQPTPAAPPPTALSVVSAAPVANAATSRRRRSSKRAVAHA